MESFFLACFAFGAIFTLISAALGAFGAGLDGAGHVGHLDVGGADPLQALHGLHNTADAAHAVPHTHGHFDAHGLAVLLTPSAWLALLTGFGAAGYVAMHFWAWAVGMALAVALATGLLLGGGVGAFILKLRADMGTMKASDYQIRGTVGRVTVSIPPGGTGEVVFSLGGVRRSEAAKALGGQAIARDTEVVITDFVKGHAEVQPLAEVEALLRSAHARHATEESVQPPPERLNE